QLENAVRDYIAENPWLISPVWETFRSEVSVDNLIKEAVNEAAIGKDPDWMGRIDLALASGSHLLIIEFMRPGLTADWEHVDRFDRYVRILREKVQNNSSRFDRVSGLLVADKLGNKAGFGARLASLRKDDMDAMDWKSLLATARAQWIDYFKILADRAPGDERMEALRDASRAFNEATEPTS